MINEDYVNFLKGTYLPNNIKNLEFEIDSVNQKFSFKVSESQGFMAGNFVSRVYILYVIKK